MKAFTDKEVSDILRNIQQLVCADDIGFDRRLLSGLTAAELAEFQKECPEFPEEHLPQKSN